MAAIKPKRSSPQMDMTAMCDVAFLLLTFFIMTTQFKSQEAVTIDTPSSISQTKVEEKDMATIVIDKAGNYYFGASNIADRYNVVDKMAAKYNVSLTEGEKKAFTKLAENGVSITGLKQYLNLSEADKERVKLTGIPNDSTKSELADWVNIMMREVNPKAKLGVKGDVNTQYPAVKKVLTELGKIDINKFQLITDVENKPSN